MSEGVGRDVFIRQNEEGSIVMAKPEWIILGIICIGFLYFFPVTQLPTGGTNDYGAFGRETIYEGVTLSQLASLCSNAIIGLFATILGKGYNCQVYTGIFYIGWIIGLVLIVYGLIPTKTVEKKPPVPKFVAGDYFDPETNSGLMWLISSYNPTTDEYITNFMKKKDDGQWGCIIGTPYSTDRKTFEEMNTSKTGYVPIESVKNCYP